MIMYCISSLFGSASFDLKHDSDKLHNWTFMFVISGRDLRWFLFRKNNHSGGWRNETNDKMMISLFINFCCNSHDVLMLFNFMVFWLFFGKCLLKFNVFENFFLMLFISLFLSLSLFHIV